jgi:hypothetical protein
MSCNCGKKPKMVVTPVPIQELPKQLTKEEIDWFNNIDVIKPISGQTENNG